MANVNDTINPVRMEKSLRTTLYQEDNSYFLPTTSMAAVIVLGGMQAVLSQAW
jgi:hypothetical protein